jgi:integrase
LVEQFKFTEARIRDQLPGEKRIEVKDTEVRLTLRITPKGIKTFYVVRKVKGRTERIRLGQWPEMSVDDARKEAAKAHVGIDGGKNPAEIRRELAEELTFGELWLLYLEQHAKKHKRSWKYDKQMYGKHLKKWEGRRLSEITTQVVANLIGRIGANDGPVAANRARALLSSMFGRAAAVANVDMPNPVAGVRRFKEQPRERYLLPDELKRFMDALEDEPDFAVEAAFKLMLFTGLRPNNVMRGKFEEINLRDGTWHIPAARMKNRRALVLPLARAGVDLLEEWRYLRGIKKGFLFPRSNGEGHLNHLRDGFSEVMAVAEIEDFTPRDLRHTFATYAGEADVPWEIIQAILGHNLPGTTARYVHVTPGRIRQGVERAVARILSVAAGEESESGEVVSFPTTNERRQS